MLVGSMIKDEVEKDMNPVGMGGFKKFIKVCIRAGPAYPLPA